MKQAQLLQQSAQIMELINDSMRPLYRKPSVLGPVVGRIVSMVIAKTCQRLVMADDCSNLNSVHTQLVGGKCLVIKHTPNQAQSICYSKHCGNHRQRVVENVCHDLVSRQQ